MGATQSVLNRRDLRLASLAAAVVLASGAAALAQPPARLQRPGAESFRLQPLTAFEKDMFDRIRDRGEVHQDEASPPADNNARGLILQKGDAAILNLSVWGRKYGIS